MSVLVVMVYRIVQRCSGRPDLSLVVLLPFLVAAMALSVTVPRTAYMPTWIVLVGSLAWVATAATDSRAISVDLAVLVEAVGFLMFLLPFMPGVFMGDGFRLTPGHVSAC